MLYNANRGPHSPRYGIEKFHPFPDIVREERKIENEEVSAMYAKKIFRELARAGFGTYEEVQKQ